MKNISQINKARNFAMVSHGNQQYGKVPYIVHLDAVAELASGFGGETGMVIAYLHDIIEDTDTTLTEIEKEFGKLVSECVGILTDEPGKSRKDRKLKTYRKMAKVSGETEISLIIKVCDRLANIKACIADNNTSLLTMYKKEHFIFKQSVYRKSLCNKLC